jgi:hypothetical protein
MDKKTFRKWGYHPTEDDRIFDVEVGGSLPEGWAERPVPRVAVDTPPGEYVEISSLVDTPPGEYVTIAAKEQRVAAAELRAKELEQENASLKEEISSLKEQLAQKEDAAPADTGLQADWRSQHHSTRIRLAKEFAPDVAELITNAKEADEVLENYEAKQNG